HERRGRRSGGGGHDGVERFGADGVCAAAFRRHVYRRSGPRAGLPAGSGQAQRVPRGAEIEKGIGTLSECGQMNHLSEEQLILHYYGEPGEPGGALDCEHHLEECGDCRALYASLQRVLNVVDSLPVPERSAEYGAAVWRRIERRVGARRRTLWALPARWRWAAAATACAALMATAFVAGRFYPRPNRPAQMAAADPQTGERVLLVAVGDYLERSQMVL